MEPRRTGDHQVVGRSALRLPRRTFLGALGVLGSSLAACATLPAPTSQPTSPPAAPATAPTPAAKAAPTKTSTRVNLGLLPIVPAAPLFLPIDKGYYADEGLDVQWDPSNQAADSMAQVAAGNLHLSQATITVGLLNGWQRGVDVKVVAGLTGYPLKPPMSEAVVVRKALWDSGQVRDANGLKGHKVAVSGLGSFSEYILDKLMRTAGLTAGDLDLTIIPFPDHPLAVANGSVDAAYTVEPFATKMEDEKISTQMPLPESVYGAQVSILIGGKAFLQDRAMAEGFMWGLLRGLGDLDRQGWGSPENAAIIEKWTKVPAATIQRMLPQYGDPEGDINWESMEDQQRFFIGRGHTTYREPFDLLRFNEDGPRLAALKALGR